MPVTRTGTSIGSGLRAWRRAKASMRWVSEVPRWAAIRVKYMDGEGKWVEEKHTGFAARIFQHEIDHLSGTLYVDRMSNMRTLMTHQEFMRRIVK